MEQISKILKYDLTDIKHMVKRGNTLMQMVMRNETFTEKEVLKILKSLLDNGFNPDTKNKKNELLQLAIVRKMKDVAEIILTYTTNVHLLAHFFLEDEYKKFKELSTQKAFFDESDSKIMQMKSESNYFLEWLISKGFDFGCGIIVSQSALCMAIEHNLQHILPLLLKGTKNINFVDEENRTLLHLFLEQKKDYYSIDDGCYPKQYRSNIVEILLNRGVPIDAEDNRNCTAVGLAIEKNEGMAIIEMLLERLTNINQKNSRGETLFYTAIKKWTMSTGVQADGYMNIARALIARGADVNAPGNLGKTPLFHAIVRWDSDYLKTDDETEMELFELLLERSVDVQQKNSKGETLFYMVIRKWAMNEKAENDYYIRISRSLIAKGADVNQPDKCGKRPLFLAIERHSLPVVKLLRENGADFDVTTKDGENLMHLLVKSSDYMKNANEEDVELFRMLIDDVGCNVNAKNKAGMSPLHVAAAHLNPRVVEKLIVHGASINCKNIEMETPIHMATKNRQVVEIIKLLVKYGANVNAKDNKGQTALHKIALESSSELSYYGIWALLSHGADVNVQDVNKRTVLSSACYRDSLAYKLLLATKHRDYYFDFAKGPLDGISINEPLQTEMASGVVTRLTAHSIKLEAANLPWDMRINGRLGDFSNTCSNENLRKKLYAECLSEIQKLKNTFIEDNVSLYTLLHMNLNRKCAYINNKELQQFVHSSKLEEQFPKYSVLILANYNEALTRKSLWQPVKEAWFKLTKIRLPDLCLDLIISFLSNADLFDMIEEE